ncbi:MAG: 3-oxoacyl-ACP reductase FabG [Xanthomonadales bacterium]|nr:3-oxoacyl-ACP reductase FabG [Gammaproteobacteria bacterium]MBT8074396.1 3-oxoacyl-ACP reductase FabG [Gammaproteobacteria bacterium]MBT8075672.1 3-oxoacyl-ACP reductase FabG [Gammaproteobacteria bacterium]NNK05248.1 3-oxoacyl-ACP reductase FabG [Xanthomonadales bacterium]NNL00514.1 3-oxoacyl-ACP reductase FabG [Xanthomonadales bacterium]
MNNGLHDKVALVTGASRGIGAAIADQLAGGGARVFGTATSDAGAAAISERNVAGLSGFRLDVNDADGIKSVLGEISAEAGAPTILVNNAGVTRDQLLMRMSEDDWTTVLDTNLRSVYRLSKACLRGMMKAREGRIISIASVIGAMGNAGQANYAAAKAGMMGFSRSLAREVGSRGITVNVVAPGFIDTDMTRELNDAQREAMLKDIPLKRLGEANDIAATVSFLASGSASYITGQTIHVNGGMYVT